MERKQAKKLIIDTFENNFDKKNYESFLNNLLKTYDKEATFTYSGIYIPNAYEDSISSLERIGKYTYEGKEIDLLVVNLKKSTYLERARTLQRNFIAWYLKESRHKKNKDAALVAFVSPESDDWRFSLVKMDYRYEETLTGKLNIKEEFTPARRWSFLVGKNEKSHTAQSRFLPILENDEHLPMLEELENAFNVETVTKEFFIKYRDLFIVLKNNLDKILSNCKTVKKEFTTKNINTVDFAKKLLGQIVFLYFLQKKGWFGVESSKNWGTGPKDFIRKLFNKDFGQYKNFFNDILEPLFYDALSVDRSAADHFYSRFNCKIPFLNGGLFDPINGYDWVNINILLPDELFSNTNRTKEDDIGDGILDVFDRFNFTVNEEEPLEKEVALDPELLGKIYEKLNAIRYDNFDEYRKVLKSGKSGEESKFNKEFGVYYTPREIVHYMCQESLIHYLFTELQETVKREDLEEFVCYADLIIEHEKTALKKSEEIKSGQIKETKYEHKLPKSIIQNADTIDNLLENIKVCDPAVGSGAFPTGILHEIVKLRNLLAVYLNKQLTTYDIKRHCIENSLYGVDIDTGAIETCKLRFWLSMIVDEEDFHTIKPLPNLDYKVVCGDSLLGVEKNLFNIELFAKLEQLKKQYFKETNLLQKHTIKNEINQTISKITHGHKEFDFEVYFSEVFHENKGFDIVIANPPYVSTKGVPEKYKESLIKYFNFADDTYNHFYFKGISILKDKGILTYISSKTFWTIQTKKNLRELLLKNKILEIFDTANPFESAMVDTCITIVQKDTTKENNEILFLDGSKNFIKPNAYTVTQNVFNTAPNKVFFKPTPYNMKIYKKFGKTVNKLLNEWWDKISTSKNIEQYKQALENYRNTLKPGDITLLGLITEGGVGLQTANNGKYIGVLEGTKLAENVRKQRPEKLLLATSFCKQKNIQTKQDAQAFLENLNEKQIRKLFDYLKEKFGRDVFGQGWLYRIVSKDEIANVKRLTEKEKLNGILGKKTFVPYDKGDKDGNRWYAPTPYYINWSRENVKFLKENSGKKGEGMPVVRNTQFYFREGFCWTDVNSTYLKSRIKENGIYDVLTMSLFSCSHLPDLYYVCLINSKFISEYVDDFINSTSHFQINDARQLPIIIPTLAQLKQFEDIFNQAFTIQKDKFNNKINESEAEKKLEIIQKELDEIVEKIYMGA